MTDLFSRPASTYAPASTGNGKPQAYSTSGLPYRQLLKASPEQYDIIQTVASATGTITFDALYVMSTDHAGDVTFSIDYQRLTVGGDPNGAWTNSGSFTFTPGSGTTIKQLLGSSQAAMRIAVVEGELVRVKITRKNLASDTHTGSFNPISYRWRAA